MDCSLQSRGEIRFLGCEGVDDFFVDSLFFGREFEDLLSRGKILIFGIEGYDFLDKSLIILCPKHQRKE